MDNKARILLGLASLWTFSKKLMEKVDHAEIVIKEPDKYQILDSLEDEIDVQISELKIIMDTMNMIIRDLEKWEGDKRRKN